MVNNTLLCLGEGKGGSKRDVCQPTVKSNTRFFMFTLPTKTPTLSHECSANSKGAIFFIQRVTFDKRDMAKSRFCNVVKGETGLFSVFTL